jgi:6-phosphogluconolactonase
MARLTIVRDAAAMSVTAAERITSLVERAIAERGTAALSLAGGRTPEPLYRLLADSAQRWRGRIDWPRVQLFWTDERSVAPDHPESNFGLAHRALIQHVPVPDTHVHRMHGELPAVDAGRLYDATLRALRDQTAGALFDVVLLGIGTDAHIASIFPESRLLDKTDQLAAGVWVPKLNQWRITLTPPALLDSNHILVMATGSEKADAIATAIDGPEEVMRYPAQLLRAAGDRVEWVLDDDAASLLRPGGA